MRKRSGFGLTAFVLIKTQHHSSDWYCRFVSEVTDGGGSRFLAYGGEYDYLLRVQVADMKSYDDFYKRLVNSVPGLSDVTSSFAMEQIKYTSQPCRLINGIMLRITHSGFNCLRLFAQLSWYFRRSSAVPLALLPC